MNERPKVPKDVTPKEFYKHIFPAQFEYDVRNGILESTDEMTLTIQVDIDGPNGGTWSIVIENQRHLEVFDKPLDNIPIVLFKMSETDWRDTVTGANKLDVEAERKITAAQSRAQFDILKNLKGKFIGELKKPDGSVLCVVVIFNGAEKPETTIQMKMEDYFQMVTGKIDAKTAFIEGKMDIEGDMVFALKLSQLQF